MGYNGFMKYSYGDKVIIKTWEEMAKEYGTDSYNEINTEHYTFTSRMENIIHINNNQRIVTIDNVVSGTFECYYNIKEDTSNSEYKCKFTDEMIKCVVENCEETDPIAIRWEILDL